MYELHVGNAVIIGILCIVGGIKLPVGFGEVSAVFKALALCGMIDRSIGDNYTFSRLKGIILAGSGECIYRTLGDSAIEILKAISLPCIGLCLAAHTTDEDNLVEVLDFVRVVYKFNPGVAERLDISLLSRGVLDSLDDDRRS